MAENNGICLIGVMDRLWFQHTILFQEHHHHSLCVSETTLKNSSSMDMSESDQSESFAYSSSNNSQTTLLASEDDEISSAEDAIISTTTPLSPQDDIKNENFKKETTSKERPTRLTTLLANKTIRSHSSSPSVQKRSKIFHSPGTTLLQKTMSCKSLCELEAEELKGFMDLGFTFNKQRLNKRIISVIPGLQRLETTEDDVKVEAKLEEEEEVEECDDDDEEREMGSGCVGYQRSGSVNCVPTRKEREMTIMRPYLSEAWLIKRPDSPLLNMKVPRASAAADMKKHLKYWARTVASVIQQES